MDQGRCRAWSLPSRSVRWRTRSSAGSTAPEPVEGGRSVAFSIASRYGTYQGLTALRDSRGAGVRITDEGIFEAQRALAREEGIFVEPSSATALTAVLQLHARRALDPDELIVVVLTSGGLKDPGASRTWMPEVPAAPDQPRRRARRAQGELWARPGRIASASH